MSKTTYIPNYAGYDIVRNSAAIQEECHSKAQEVASFAAGYGGTYELYDQAGPHRCRTRVVTADPHAMNANRKYNALVKALGGAYVGPKD